MMSKRAAAGLGVAAVLLVTLCVCIYASPWTDLDEMHSIPYNQIGDSEAEAGMAPNIYDDAKNLKTTSLNYAVFEQYGPLLLVLAVLMFGAMVGGICVAREEEETDDSN